MKYINFEDYLQETHMKRYPTILDDELPDAYDKWISELSPKEWIEFADVYAKKR